MALLCCDSCGHEWIGRAGARCRACGSPYVGVQAGGRRGRTSNNPLWLCGTCGKTYHSKRELPRCRGCYAAEKRIADMMDVLIAEEEKGGG